MTYYAHYNKNSNELSKAECKCLSDSIINIEISQDVFDNIEQYIYQDGEVVKNPEYPTILLNNAKKKKVEENDRLRDEALNAGVTYNNVLFDSDTDQKVNLLARYNTMSDTDTIVWYGKDNQGLLCTKSDLLAIGELITQLHSYCWENNAYIKEQIEAAISINELDNISIHYDLNEV